MSAHLDDSDLIRYLDGGAAAAEQAAADEHVDSCETCAARVTAYRTRMQRLGELLRETDPPVPTMRAPQRRVWRRPEIAIAAALLVLVGVSVTVRPVRAWIIDRSRDLWAIVTGAEREPPRAMLRPTDATTASVTFVPSGDTFTVRVAAFQAAGTISVAVGPDSTVTAEVLEGTREHLLVLPAGLRIVNAGSSEARYEITIPVHLSSVTIEVNGRRLAQIEPRGVASRWTVDLAARPNR